MQYLKDSGFVVRRVNLRDSDRYITIFTKNHGKIEVLAKGVRKMTSRRASSVELLSLIDFQAVKSSKTYILTEVKLIDSFDQLKRDLEYIEQVFTMCELIEAIMPIGQSHPEVFDLMNRALCKMLEEKRTMAYFQAKLLSILGFWDSKASFRNEAHVQEYVEQVIERKLKTPQAFEF